jgi:hypothetical protein
MFSDPIRRGKVFFVVAHAKRGLLSLSPAVATEAPPRRQCEPPSGQRALLARRNSVIRRVCSAAVIRRAPAILTKRVLTAPCCGLPLLRQSREPTCSVDPP